MGKTSFKPDKEDLSSLLKQVADGDIQLPDFQRGWVWDDIRIKKIVSSILQSFPIGVIILLETGGGTRFKPKPIEGVEDKKVDDPEYLILDGQQRITSLFQALYTQDPVNTENEKGKPIKRHYYINIERYLACDHNSTSDVEECIVSVPEDKIIRSNFGRDIILDLSNDEKEFKNIHFPLNEFMGYKSWENRFQKYWNYNPNKIELISEFWERAVQVINKYNVAKITIEKDTSKNAVCKIFEYVNTGGVELNVFELLTATYATENFSLREDWKRISTTLDKPNLRVYRKYDSDKDIRIDATSFLQIVSLLSTYEKRLAYINNPVKGKRPPAISCKKDAILALELNDYIRFSEMALTGLKKTAEFFHEKYIYTYLNIPYTTQIVPLSAIFAMLKDDEINANIHNKFSQWFWCGVFGEMYSGANETRYANDLFEFIDWVYGGKEPGTVSDATISERRLDELKTRTSAAYKGVFALLMNEGAFDFISCSALNNAIFFDKSIDIHHIFPRKWCEDNKDRIDKGYDYESIINKAPISATTNRGIGGKSPSNYIKRIERDSSKEKMNVVLKSHMINPDFLKIDDFNSFYQDRKSKIINAIEKVTGKRVRRDEEE